MMGDDLTRVEGCTMQLRWVRQDYGSAERKLQQAWSVILVDSSGAVYKKYLDWRDVPFEDV